MISNNISSIDDVTQMLTVSHQVMSHKDKYNNRKYLHGKLKKFNTDFKTRGSGF